MSDKIKILALMGPAGSGKDTIASRIITKGLIPNAHEIVLCTTRPRREYEENHKDYHFLTESDFLAMKEKGNMLAVAKFNDWYYGTAKNTLFHKGINIGVYSPDALRWLTLEPDIDLCVWYILASDRTRLIRQLKREKDPDINEIIRRYTTDKHDFDIEQLKSLIYACNNFNTIANEDTKPGKVARAIVAACQNWLNE